jgi:hypothetical protein
METALLRFEVEVDPGFIGGIGVGMTFNTWSTAVVRY